MQEFGDPSEVQVGPDLITLDKRVSTAPDGKPYVYHHLLTQIVGMMILRLSDEMNLPFDFSALARDVLYYANDLKSYAGNLKLDISSVRDAAGVLAKNAVEMGKWNEEWMKQWMAMGHIETTAMTQHRFSRNARMINFEKHLLDLDGVPGRSWFKNGAYN